jgi:hypothetical protein
MSLEDVRERFDFVGSTFVAWIELKTGEKFHSAPTQVPGSGGSNWWSRLPAVTASPDRCCGTALHRPEWMPPRPPEGRHWRAAARALREGVGPGVAHVISCASRPEPRSPVRQASPARTAPASPGRSDRTRRTPRPR